MRGSSLLPPGPFELPLDHGGLSLAIDAGSGGTRDDRRKRRTDNLLILGGRVILRGTEALQERFGSLRDIRACVDAAGDIREAVRQDRIIEDHGGAGRAQAVDRFQERLPRFRLQRHFLVPSSLRGGLRGARRGRAMKGHAGSAHDERRYAEAFALEGVGL